MRKLRITDLLLFTKYIAVSLKSGITLVDAIEMIWDQSKGQMKSLTKKILENIKAGDSFHEALSKYPDDFSPIYINLVKTGEISGTLEESLNQLSLQQSKSYELRKKIRSAMMYPMLVFVAILGLGFSIAIFVLPKILPLFTAMGTDLPTSTKVLLAVAKLFDDHGGLIILATILTISSLIVISRFSIVKPYTHKLILNLPFMGKIIRSINLERFARTLGTLLKSAVTVDESLKIIFDSTENRVYKKAFGEFIQEVAKGNSLSKALVKHENLFPKLISKMVGMGEATGNLDEMLLYLGEFYENEVDTTMKDLSTVLEPALLIIIGLVVGAVALSILGPIYKITGSLQ